MMSRGKKFLIGLAGAVLLLLIAGSIAYLVIDEGRPADTDLRPVRAPIPETENGFSGIDIPREAIDMDVEDREYLSPFTKEWNPRALDEGVGADEEVLLHLAEPRKSRGVNDL